mgnify:CR=1 FL=1
MGGRDRDKPKWPYTIPVWRQWIGSLLVPFGRLGGVDLVTTPPELNDALVWNGESWVPGPGGSVIAPVLTGSNSSSTATHIDLKMGAGIAVQPGGLGVPVAATMTATSVAVSWLMGASGDPPSTWTLKLHKRTGEGTLNEVATFTVNTQ